MSLLPLTKNFNEGGRAPPQTPLAGKKRNFVV